MVHGSLVLTRGYIICVIKVKNPLLCDYQSTHQKSHFVEWMCICVGDMPLIAGSQYEALDNCVVDGVGVAARLKEVRDLTYDPLLNIVYIAEMHGHRIRCMTLPPSPAMIGTAATIVSSLPYRYI
jgi:hypothetical protein